MEYTVLHEYYIICFCLFTLSTLTCTVFIPYIKKHLSNSISNVKQTFVIYLSQSSYPFFKNDVFLEVPSFKYHRFRTTWGWHRIAFLLHCPKNNLNSLIKTEPLTVGADATFYYFVLLVSVPKYSPITKYIYIPLHPLQPRQA